MVSINYDKKKTHTKKPSGPPKTEPTHGGREGDALYCVINYNIVHFH